MKFPPSISLVLGFCVSAPADGFGGWRGMADREPLPPFRPPQIGNESDDEDNF